VPPRGAWGVRPPLTSTEAPLCRRPHRPAVPGPSDKTVGAAREAQSICPLIEEASLYKWNKRIGTESCSAP